MTVAAPPDRSDQIGAAVPRRAPCSIGPPWPTEAFGDRNDRSPHPRGCKDPGRGCSIEPRDGGYTVQKGFQIRQIAVTQAVVEGNRESRQIMRIIGCDPRAQRSGEIGKTPSADAGLSVGCDVGREDGSERCFESTAARVRATAVLGVGVALIATCRRGQVGAARRRPCIRGFRCDPGDGQEYGGESRRQSFSFSRNVSWQAPQPFFPRSPKAVCMAALSPLLTATRSASALAAAVF